MSFSNWLDEKKEGSLSPKTATLDFAGIFGGGSDSTDVGNGNDSDQTLPLFNPSSINIAPDLGWSNMKASLEAQMPQKILGMNYQQRFKVNC